MEMLLCSWCHANNQQGLSQCAACGAPLNSDDRVSDSGFREAPKLRDMEEFTFSSSTLQIEGKYVPMVEINLHPDDSVYFEQHTIMAKDAQVRLTKKPLNGKRRAHGMPYSVLSASGPGFISFSRDAPGELVVMPIHEHTELDVREHAFLLASHTVDYQFVRIKGLANMVHGGNGMYLDQFTAKGPPESFSSTVREMWFKRPLLQGKPSTWRRESFSTRTPRSPSTPCSFRASTVASWGTMCT